MDLTERPRLELGQRHPNHFDVKTILTVPGAQHRRYRLRYVSPQQADRRTPDGPLEPGPWIGATPLGGDVAVEHELTARPGQTIEIGSDVFRVGVSSDGAQLVLPHVQTASLAPEEHVYTFHVQGTLYFALHATSELDAQQQADRLVALVRDGREQGDVVEPMLTRVEISNIAKPELVGAQLLSLRRKQHEDVWAVLIRSRRPPTPDHDR
jgi:hypothetical protein